MRGMLRVKAFLRSGQQALRVTELIGSLRINGVITRSKRSRRIGLDGSKAFQRGVQMGDGVVQIHNTSQLTS